MADTFTINIFDTATVDGTANVLKAVVTGTYSLRVSPFSVSTFAGTHLGKGAWSFGTVTDGNYELWDESGTPAKMENYGRFEIVNNTPTFGATTFTANVAMGSNKLTGLAAGSGAGDSVRYEQVPKLSTVNSFTDVNTFTGGIAVTTAPIVTSQNINFGGVARPINVPNPVSGGDGSNKTYVDEQVGLVSVTPYQISPNERRLIPNGTQQTNQVYLTWGTAQNNANSFASATRPMNVVVEGSGTAGTTITASNEGIPGINTFNSWVSVSAKSKKYKIILPDESITVTADSVVLGNLFLQHDDLGLGATPVLNGFIFDNCYLNLISVSTFTFVNCEFRGHCTIKCSAGTVTYTTCKGGVVVTNTTLPSSIVGFDGLTLANI